MKIIDTHTHTNCEELIPYFQEIIKELETNQIYANIVGCNLSDSKLAIEQALESDNLFATIGIHPNDVNKELNIDQTLTQLSQWYYQYPDKIIAIGEIGFDFHYQNDPETKVIQEKWFRSQIDLAKKLGLPIMMHIRDAHHETIELLKEYQNDELTFIVHCFTGTSIDAKHYIELGCYISYSGIITFKNSNELRSSLNYVPLDRLLTETDAPYLAPDGYRGKLNFPYYVRITNEYLANYFGISTHKFNEIAFSNALRCFKLKIPHN